MVITFYIFASFEQMWTTKYTGLVESVEVVKENSKWPGKQKISWLETNYLPGIGKAKLSLSQLNYTTG